jgi:hypothetical protein
MTAPTCKRCGHARDAHLHLRSGTDCADCDCPSWVRFIWPGRRPK